MKPIHAGDISPEYSGIHNIQQLHIPDISHFQLSSAFCSGLYRGQNQQIHY